MIGLSLVFVAPSATLAQREGNDGARVRGKITAISGANIDLSRRDGTAVTIQTTGETTFTIDGEPATLADFSVDDAVSARVHRDGNGGVVANEIRSRSNRTPNADGRVAGQVASVDAAEGSVTISGRNGNSLTIYTTADTRIVRDRKPATVADFVAGDRVKAHGERDPNGHFIADRILGGSGRPQ